MSRFDIAAGQERAWQMLARSFVADRVASTYLFCGPEGTGAWALALETAALLNCETIEKSTDDVSSLRPCGQCHPCRSIYNINFEGLQVVLPIGPHKKLDEAIDLTNEAIDLKRGEPFRLLPKPKQISIPIDLAREVKKSLSRQPAKGITRVVLFYEMDRMKAASADALLKMIEEPPANTILIMTAARADTLLPTIQSRSLKINLERLPEEPVVAYLKERYQLSDSRARLVSRLTDHNLGQAIDIASDNESDDPGNRSVGFLIFKTVVTVGPAEALALASDSMSMQDRGAIERLLGLWLSLIRDASYFESTGDEEALINVDLVGELRHLAPAFGSNAAVQAATDAIKNTLADLRLNVHIQPALAALMIRIWAELEPVGNPRTKGG